MYNLTIRSIFRDSVSYIPQYFYQIDKFLQICRPLDSKINFVLLEGDSIDNTYELLNQELDYLKLNYGVTGEIIKFDTNLPKEPRDINVGLRFKRIAIAWNKNLETKSDSTLTVLVESDLLWDAPSMYGMVSNFMEEDTAMAPMLLTESGLSMLEFYDTHGFKRGNRNFDGRPPYWKQCPEDKPNDIWLRMDTIGGFVLCDKKAMDKVRWNSSSCVLEWSKETKVWMNRGAVVLHPRGEFV